MKSELAVVNLGRAMLALWVFVAHCGSIVSGGLIPTAGPAVDSFMMISGLLMTLNYSARGEKEFPARPSTWFKFYIRRFFRIAPLYYLAYTVYLIFSWCYVGWEQQLAANFPKPWRSSGDPTENQITIFSVFLHYSFLHGFFPSQVANNPIPDWSLSLEMQFYLVFPFIFLFCNRFGWALAAVVGLAIAFVATRVIAVYVTEAPKVLGLWPQPGILPLKIHCFIAGMVLARLVLNSSSGKLFAKRSSWPLIGALLVLSIAGQTRFFTLFLAITSIALLTHGFISALINRVSSLPIFSVLSDLSYGVYIMHKLILIPVAFLMVSFDGFNLFAPPQRFAILFLISAPITFLVAWLFYNYVEKPGIEFGKNIASRI